MFLVYLERKPDKRATARFFFFLLTNDLKFAAEEIIRRSDLKLWVTIFDEQPFLSDMPLTFLSAFTHLKTHGYKGMSTFLAGHGDGGKSIYTL